MTTPVPAVNVNLKPCARFEHCEGGDHDPSCPAEPILLPCPIPRSVVFNVALGECTCPQYGRLPGERWKDCTARPISVACTIGGDGTWAGSEVTEANVVEMDSIARILDAQDDGAKGLSARLVAACRQRWEIVKALVLGKAQAQPNAKWIDAPTDFFTQRDAVYAALADMARAEEVIQEKWEEFPLVLRVDAHFGPPETRSSEHLIAAYVAHVIEQVGVLP